MKSTYNRTKDPELNVARCKCGKLNVITGMPFQCDYCRCLNE